MTDVVAAADKRRSALAAIPQEEKEDKKEELGDVLNTRRSSSYLFVQVCMHRHALLGLISVLIISYRKLILQRAIVR